MLLLRDRATGNYGALGISRRKELAFRDVVHPTVSSALTSFRDAYAKLWHAVVKVRVGLPVGHGDAASDAEVAAAADAEKTLAVALSNPAAADALRSKRAERAGAELADELASASEEVFEDARDAESDDNW